MTRYLVEVSHENTKQARQRAVLVFMATGSHFMTNADWGCSDDVHKAWFIVDMESKDQAILMLPPLFRPNAKVVALQRFGMEDVDRTMEQHKA